VQFYHWLKYLYNFQSHPVCTTPPQHCHNSREDLLSALAMVSSTVRLTNSKKVPISSKLVSWIRTTLHFYDIDETISRTICAITFLKKLFIKKLKRILYDRRYLVFLFLLSIYAIFQLRRDYFLLAIVICMAGQNSVSFPPASEV
jgi:hypothetical protein